MRFSEIRTKEIIGVPSGERLGYVYDIELDEESGAVRALLVPGAYRFLGVLGREEDIVIPWNMITKIGDDLIIVSR